MSALRSTMSRISEHLNRRLIIAAGLLCWLGAAGLLVAARPVKAGALFALGAVVIVLASRIEAMGQVAQARALMSDGEFDAALLKLNRAIKIAPRLVTAYLVRRAAYTGTSHLGRALNDAGHAVRLAPRPSQALLTR